MCLLVRFYSLPAKCSGRDLPLLFSLAGPSPLADVFGQVRCTSCIIYSYFGFNTEFVAQSCRLLLLWLLGRVAGQAAFHTLPREQTRHQFSSPNLLPPSLHLLHYCGTPLSEGKRQKASLEIQALILHLERVVNREWI